MYIFLNLGIMFQLFAKKYRSVTISVSNITTTNKVNYK